MPLQDELQQQALSRKSVTLIRQARGALSRSDPQNLLLELLPESAAHWNTSTNSFFRHIKTMCLTSSWNCRAHLWQVFRSGRLRGVLGVCWFWCVCPSVLCDDSFVFVRGPERFRHVLVPQCQGPCSPTSRPQAGGIIACSTAQNILANYYILHLYS